jgi:hypothetical protein
LIATARACGQIENALHRQLDVAFIEDAADNGPASAAFLHGNTLRCRLRRPKHRPGRGFETMTNDHAF